MNANALRRYTMTAKACVVASCLLSFSASADDQSDVVSLINKDFKRWSPSWSSDKFDADSVFLTLMGRSSIPVDEVLYGGFSIIHAGSARKIGFRALLTKRDGNYFLEKLCYFIPDTNDQVCDTHDVPPVVEPPRPVVKTYFNPSTKGYDYSIRYSENQMHGVFGLLDDAREGSDADYSALSNLYDVIADLPDIRDTLYILDFSGSLIAADSHPKSSKDEYDVPDLREGLLKLRHQAEVILQMGTNDKDALKGIDYVQSHWSELADEATSLHKEQGKNRAHLLMVAHQLESGSVGTRISKMTQDWKMMASAMPEEYDVLHYFSREELAGHEEARLQSVREHRQAEQRESDLRDNYQKEKARCTFAPRARAPGEAERCRAEGF